MSYVPGSRFVTDLPDASWSEIVKVSFLPTVATSFGLSALASAEGSNMAPSSTPSRIRMVMPALYGRASGSVSRPASIERATPSASSTIPSTTPTHSGNPVKGSVAPAGPCTAERTAEDSLPAILEWCFDFDRIVELSVLDDPVAVVTVTDELPGSEGLSSGPPLEPVGRETEPQVLP